jgi:hypothetical protein
MTTFPLIGTLGLAANVLEFWLDKFRLVTICQTPVIKENPVRGILMLGSHILVALTAILAFPNGAAWIFAGTGVKNNCHFFS